MEEKKKVLLVDDEIDFLEIIGARIKNWGYELITATNGKEGIDALKNKRPDIIVLDYMMPEMDGVTTLKKMRKINSEIPVIMFSAFPDRRALEGTEELGIKTFIPKLSSFSDVQGTLRSAINMAEKEIEKNQRGQNG